MNEEKNEEENPYLLPALIYLWGAAIFTAFAGEPLNMFAPLNFTGAVISTIIYLLLKIGKNKKVNEVN